MQGVIFNLLLGSEDHLKSISILQGSRHVHYKLSGISFAGGTVNSSGNCLDVFLPHSIDGSYLLILYSRHFKLFQTRSLEE